MAHGEVYAAEFGWDTSFEALVARIVADYASAADQARSAAWIAEVDGQRAGCVFCVQAEPDAPAEPDAQAESDAQAEPGAPAAREAAGAGDTAQLRILLVHPRARGHGAGDRLVTACMDFARSAGYARMRLWTNDVLAAARVIYLRHGFTLAEQDPHRSFGADLVGQVYEARLAPVPAAR
jgi:GNAT superfamily N-acetyltransferase